MNYYARVYKLQLSVLLVLLLFACLSVVAISINIYITPELHNQFLEISSVDTGWSFGYFSDSVFSMLLSFNRIIKPLLVVYSLLISGYLMTSNKLRHDSRIIGKTQVISSILTISIFPLLLFGLVVTICRSFISYPYPAYFLVVINILILGILLFFKIKLELLHTNNKYQNRLTKNTIIQIIIYLVLIGLFILFPHYLLLAVIGLGLIILFTNHLIKYTITNVGL